MQEQAEANRDGMRVSEEMVRITDWTEQEATKGGRGAESHESGPTHRAFSPQLWASSGIYTHHVPSLRASHHHHHDARQGQGQKRPHHYQHFFRPRYHLVL